MNRTHKQTQARHELAMNKIRLELDRQPTFMHIKNDRKILMSLNNKHMEKTNRNEAIPAPSTATTSEKTYSVVLSKELKLALKKSRRHRHLFLFCSPFETFFVPLFVLFCFWPLASQFLLRIDYVTVQLKLDCVWQNRPRKTNMMKFNFQPMFYESMRNIFRSFILDWIEEEGDARSTIEGEKDRIFKCNDCNSLNYTLN